ncbi:MAG TPA: hypothetical protein VLH79_03815 [Chthonomonadales bacterium]|nr:hypothetical protein [Chthonomonadales bacterium]
MATITGANLAVTVDNAKKTARCVVSCRVFYTAYEMREMREGLRFALHCSLWGEDLGMWLNPDDFLYSYPSRHFPDATPTNPESASFEVTLGLSLLDEDWGTDEVYGLLTLKNLYTGNKVKAKTNVVKRKF